MKKIDLKEIDAEIFSAIEKEKGRQENKIEMIASENFTDFAVMEASGSVLTNKYAEGYPGKRYYGGCEFVDEVETLAIERAKKLFGAEYANVQPHSGSSANIGSYFALLNPGDRVLGMDLSSCGHLTHGSRVNMSGKYFDFISYGLEEKTERIDFNEVKKLTIEYKPKMIVAGASAYPRTVETEKFREIADEVGAILLVDMAHFAGLVAAGEHPNPVKYADVVTSTTHKTLRGPRGGLILAREEYAAKLNKAIFPGIQGGPLMHIIAAKAVCFKEAMEPAFKEYQAQVIKNAKALAEALIAGGYNIVSGGTDNHLVLLNLIGKDITGKEAEEALDAANITTNKNAVPKDPLGPNVTSGVRLGTPAMTTRGFDEADVRETARAILVVLDGRGSDEAITEARKIVGALTEKRPLYA
jgi:glycine hydroxymethyltransferase